MADSFATELAANSVPRCGPVAVVFVPLNKDQSLNAENLSSYSFADFAKSFNTKIFSSAGDQLPDIKLEYVVPIDAAYNAVSFRDPHPETRYRSTDVNVVNDAFPRLGLSG